MQLSPHQREELRAEAQACGFVACHFTPAARAIHADDFLQWLDDGAHAEMAWMARDPQRRCDPREVLPHCATVICLASNYFPGNAPPQPRNYQIARYAWNDDYHDVLLERLKRLDAWLQQRGGVQRYYVDTGPVLERDFASAAGLGWNGKSTVQIHPRYGTWLFLAEILTTLDIAADAPMSDHCGKCTRCIDACPTAAITAPHRVDARRCLSYWSIEHKGSIPVEFRAAMGDRVYGCDACLAICPWNRFAQVSQEAQFHARHTIFSHELRDFLAFDDDTFRRVFAGSPIKRIKRSRWLRNVCVVLGNVGTAADLPALQRAAIDADPLIAEHAIWAIAQIQERLAAIV